jgi:hypothetical protein
MSRPFHSLCVACLLALSTAAPALAQDANGSAEGSGSWAESRASDRVHVTLEAAEAATEIGAPTEFVANIEAPAGWQLVGVRPLGNRFVELLADEDRGSEVDRGRWTHAVQLAVFRPGRYEVEGLRAEFIAPDGTRRHGDSAPLAIVVSSTISNETDPAPAPNDPAMAVRTLNRPLIGTALALALIGLGAFIAYLWRKRRQLLEALNAPPPPPRPAHEVALEKLDQLERDSLLEAGGHQEYHTRLSEILREFLGARISAGVLEMTTAEIAVLLADRHREVGSHAESILTILGEMDLVKFARLAPSTTASTRLFDDVRAIVLEMSARERELSQEPPAPPTAAALPPVPPETPRPQ